MLKNIFAKVLVTVFCSVAVQTTYAQGIGINETGAAPDSSAILDASSSDKGFLFPRMTTAQRNNISSPSQGLLIFNLDTDCVELYFANGGWKAIECGCTSFPDATFPNPGGAANVPVNFDANTVVSSNTYNWIFDQGTPSSSADTSETVTWTTANTYEVTLTVSDENNCVSTHTENVVIVPCASFPDATFTGSNGSINSSIAFSANGSGAGYTYDWTFPSGTPSTSTQQNPSVEWATDGTYTVELTVTDNLSCSATDTMEVTIDLCAPDGPWNFTNASATGRFGPSQTQINTAYSGTNLDGDVTINTQGIQEWTVPSTGTYLIEVFGAQGGSANNYSNSNGGLGASIIGEVSLNAGDELKILVGQQGGSTSSNVSAGGGGATFVVNSFNNNPIFIAAGGGGGGHANNNPGQDGLISNNGNTNGGSSPGNAGGGGGLSGNGASGTTQGGLSFFNDGVGGSDTGYNNYGGFGGGGAGWSQGGGGGGHNGGDCGPNGNQGGFGGGSFNSGTNQTNTAGANTGNGYVTIEKICP